MLNARGGGSIQGYLNGRAAVPGPRLAPANWDCRAVSTYAVGADGALTPLGVTPTGQRATCWIDASGNLLAASNAGSGTVTTLRADGAGTTTKLADTATTSGGTVDADFTRDGRYLYVQTGANGGVDTFAVGAGGTLTARGSVTVPDGVGGEDIVTW